MKKLFFFAMIALMVTSCKQPSQSVEFMTLQAQYDSLAAAKAELEANYGETLDILNEIEVGFDEISTTERSLVLQVNNADGQPASKKQQINNRIEQIKHSLANQQEKINDLQKRLNASGSKNKQLSATIDRLQKELNEKTQLAVALQEELAAKNTIITELEGTVHSLNENVATLTKESEEQKETILSQDADLNKVYFFVGNETDLVAAGLVEKGGLFKSDKVLGKEFDRSVLTKMDRRRLSQIPLAAEKYKILTSHPEGSYTIETDGAGIATLDILDPDLFWSVSRILIVRTK